MTAAESFRLRVEGVFDLSERGTTVLGPILAGEVSIGDVLAVEGRETGPRATCVGIDAAPRMLRTMKDALPRVGLTVTAWSRDDVAEGDVLVATERA
ncbi:hypothetical protein [Nocardioides sp.]|uniref:hypothetical protein n=1 Tax=Nocardioides sp. TaxID=35761 RepID=UPI002C7E88FB|nr:hypothetical protein [Nocardioides sp.]HXH80426.1 hypothetical protein [Nocardioides sp.]